VEADDLAQHPQVARARGGAGGEQAADAAGTGILQAATVAVARHAHVGVLGGDAELAEQAQQCRVGALVVHDEAGVDGERGAAAAGDFVGVGVPAEPGVGL